MNRADLQDFRAKLIAMQSEIRAISASAAPDIKPVVLDQTSVGRLSRIDAMPLQQMSQEVARRRQQLLLKIEGALCHIESGRFPIGILPFLNVLNGIRLHGRFEHMPKASLQLEIGFDRLALGDIGVGDHSVTTRSIASFSGQSPVSTAGLATLRSFPGIVEPAGRAGG